jgi:hypothetical protein
MPPRSLQIPSALDAWLSAAACLAASAISSIGPCMPAPRRCVCRPTPTMTGVSGWCNMQRQKLSFLVDFYRSLDLFK